MYPVYNVYVPRTGHMSYANLPKVIIKNKTSWPTSYIGFMWTVKSEATLSTQEVDTALSFQSLAKRFMELTGEPSGQVHPVLYKLRGVKRYRRQNVEITFLWLYKLQHVYSCVCTVCKCSLHVLHSYLRTHKKKYSKFPITLKQFGFGNGKRIFC
jgi:hypothetical protein